MSDKQSFVRSLTPHQGLIRSLCAAYFPDEEDRADAFQEVLLQLWRSYPTFRGESSFVTWLYRIALRTLIRLAKRQRRDPAGPYPVAYEPVVTPPSDSQEIIHSALGYLTPPDKALVLLYLEGYRTPEIAEVLDLTPTNVSTRFGRIKQKLRAIISHELSWN